MFYTRYDGEKLQSAILMCECMCSALVFEIIDDTMFVSVFGSQFSERQESSLIENTKRLFKKIFRKDVYIAGLMVDAEEIRDFLEILKEFEFTENKEPEEYKNYSDFKVVPIGDKAFEVLIEYTGPLSKIARKFYRASEIRLKEDEWEELLEYLYFVTLDISKLTARPFKEEK